jgi:hypothetical protein
VKLLRPQIGTNEPALTPNDVAIVFFEKTVRRVRKESSQMAANESAMSKVANAVKAVATTTAQAAEEYVVEPVGKALGLIEPEVELKSKSQKKAERKAAIARAVDTKKNRRAT